MKESPMAEILFTWIGAIDFRAMNELDLVGVGPVARASKEKMWDKVVLLCDYPKIEGDRFRTWLKAESKTKTVELHQITLSSPTDFAEIYAAADYIVKETQNKLIQPTTYTFHLSPGTPAMAAVWIILSKTKYPSTLIESSRDHGVKTVSIPFDISADYIPDQLHTSDDKIIQLAAGLSGDSPAFKNIIHRSEIMQRVVIKARLAAIRSIPVLIEGESGTGKELLAKAIHAESPRARKPFITINCGAIPEELIESELFGHEKGAFTGASTKRQGHFEAADSGTLFLDEIGELPLAMQVKLLRTLQEEEVKPVGATIPTKIDVRIIAATNRNLLQEVTAGNFRDDLFYRLAVAVLKLPPLRERQGDLSMLIDSFMERINIESQESYNGKHKIISVSAKNLLLRHHWPGNIREMINTLTRATVWSAGEIIQEEDIQDALLPVPVDNMTSDSILNKPIAQGIDLPAIIQKVATHYLEKGMNITHGNKAKATKLLGLPNYQTLTNWLKKYEIE